MKIVKYIHHSEEDLIDGLRQITMLQDTNAFPYKEAEIELQVFKAHELKDLTPAQLYVSFDEVTKVQSLQWALAEHGLNLFKLDGYVTAYFEGMDEPIDIMPPVIEMTYEDGDNPLFLINDGMHRTYLAIVEREPLQVILISNVPAIYPYYAYPLPNGWDDVTLMGDPATGIKTIGGKKFHRIKNYHSLYRNFSSGPFQNVGGPRKFDQ